MGLGKLAFKQIIASPSTGTNSESSLLSPTPNASPHSFNNNIIPFSTYASQLPLLRRLLRRFAPLRRTCRSSGTIEALKLPESCSQLPTRLEIELKIPFGASPRRCGAGSVGDAVLAQCVEVGLGAWRCFRDTSQMISEPVPCPFRLSLIWPVAAVACNTVSP